MSREIKFRAWDGNKAVDFGDLMCKQGHFNAFINTLAERTAANKPNDNKYKLMQYTGLKDKNGVEIYEGDVVEHGSRDELDFGVGTVERNKEWACFELKCSYDWGDTHTSNEVIAASREWRVIGNIYENPELLEAEL